MPILVVNVLAVNHPLPHYTTSKSVFCTHALRALRGAGPCWSPRSSASSRSTSTCRCPQIHEIQDSRHFIFFFIFQLFIFSIFILHLRSSESSSILRSVHFLDFIADNCGTMLESSELSKFSEYVDMQVEAGRRVQIPRFKFEKSAINVSIYNVRTGI